VLPRFQPIFISSTNCAAVMSLKVCELPPELTVTVAVPLLVVSAVDVALIVSDVRVSAAATVSKPLVLIVVPAFLPVWSIDQLTVCAGLFVPVTVAVKICVAPFATVAVLGLTVTPVTVGGLGTTAVGLLVTLPE